jgi:hypothetical protein
VEENGMDSLIILITIAGMLTVGGILFMGIRAMASHHHDDEEEDRLMFARVATQAAVILLLLLVVFAVN